MAGPITNNLVTIVLAIPFTQPPVNTVISQNPANTLTVGSPGPPGPQGPTGVALGVPLYIQGTQPAAAAPWMWVQTDTPSAGNQMVWVSY